MHARVRDEIELLKKQFPDLQHGEKLDWVLLPLFALPPDRFNKEKTKVFFRIPVGYPVTGPDNFHVDNDLRLKNGTPAPAFNAGWNGTATLAGEWGWFSWHPQQWRPAATIEGGDNLLGFVRAISLCLRGEESA